MKLAKRQDFKTHNDQTIIDIVAADKGNGKKRTNDGKKNDQCIC